MDLIHNLWFLRLSVIFQAGLSIVRSFTFHHSVVSKSDEWTLTIIQDRWCEGSSFLHISSFHHLSRRWTSSSSSSNWKAGHVAQSSWTVEESWGNLASFKAWILLVRRWRTSLTSFLVLFRKQRSVELQLVLQFRRNLRAQCQWNLDEMHLSGHFFTEQKNWTSTEKSYPVQLYQLDFNGHYQITCDVAHLNINKIFMDQNIEKNTWKKNPE